MSERASQSGTLSTVVNLRQQCFEEAREREMRFADAASMSRTRHVGQALDELAQKEARERGPTYLDSRTCGCCGARWGRCEHTSEESE